jgi:L-iditol 2-dehydrogenase
MEVCVEYAVKLRVSDAMSDAEATLVVTAGTLMYGLTELGWLPARASR